MIMMTGMLLSDDERSDLEELAIRYQEALYQKAYSVLHSREDAEEAVQNLFLSMTRTGHVPKADAPGIRSILLIAVQRKAIDIYNDNKRRAVSDISELSDCIPDNSAQDPEARMVLKDAVKRLPAELQEILMMNVLLGWPPEKIAKHMGIKTNTVQKKIKKAKDMLNTILKGEA